MPRLSLYAVKSLTLQMEKKEPAQWSVAGPQMRSRSRLNQQAGAGPSHHAPPAPTTMQPGPSTQNMSFEEAYEYYAYGNPSSFQAGSSGYAGDQGPYYPQVCAHLMVHRWILRHQHASTMRTRFFRVSRTFRTASAHLGRSSRR